MSLLRQGRQEGIREEQSKLCSGQIKFEMSIRHAIRDIKYIVGYLNPEPRRRPS